MQFNQTSRGFLKRYLRSGNQSLAESSCANDYSAASELCTHSSLPCFVILESDAVDISPWSGSRMLGLVNKGSWKDLIRPQWWEDTSVLGSGSSLLSLSLLFNYLAWEPRAPKEFHLCSQATLSFGSLGLRSVLPGQDAFKQVQHAHLLQQRWVASTDQQIWASFLYTYQYYCFVLPPAGCAFLWEPHSV